MLGTGSTAPRLELEWEEGLFKLVGRWLRRLRPIASQAATPGSVALEGLQGRLAVLASMMAGRMLTVEGGAPACALRGDALLLPDHMSVSTDPAENEAAYRAVAMLAGAMRRHRRAVPLGAAVREQEALRLAEEARAWILAELVELQPEAVAALTGARVALLSHPEGDDSPADDEAGGRGREARAPKLGDVRRRLLSQDPEDDNPIVHTFEKVETLEAQAGGRRFADGSDELDEHLEALDEVELQELVRGGPQTQALLRADITLEAAVPNVESVAPGEHGVRYDEWDAGLGAYRKDWCTVYPTPVAPGGRAAIEAVRRGHRREIEALYRRVDAHRSRLRAVRGQRDGEEVDLDAVVCAAADRAAGREGSDRLYLRRTRRERDVSVVVLLDVSLSTDSWVADRRVLDVARSAAVVFGEVVDRLGDELSVLAFASKTRNVCRVFEVKAFQQRWAEARGALAALEPQGYTRIGPALRHATAQLATQPSQKKLLLLVSDGKPTDYDRYEGRHGEADVRMAVREAHRLGVVTHALTIDSVTRGHLPATFGPGGWHVLSNPNHLPRAMAEIYGRLAAG
ncbi:MAG: VWA domain-containing protein [Myxococcales bacterium]|nr:VWA domain-containing protein [Myxococcales bacterium]MCB9648944.1 VWA domain-containing protein [Deltaproteobacteria bacterium]